MSAGEIFGENKTIQQRVSKFKKEREYVYIPIQNMPRPVDKTYIDDVLIPLQARLKKELHYLQKYFDLEQQYTYPTYSRDIIMIGFRYLEIQKSIDEKYVNYGNPVESKRIHYPIITCGYIKDATRFTVSYGRQRAGLFCVGGVCRFVPANNGLTFSFTQSF